MLLWPVFGVTITTLFILEPTMAEVAKGPKKSVGDWGKSWEADQISNPQDGAALGLLSRVAVVRKSGSGFTVLPLEQTEASQDSFLQVPEERQISLTRFVNKSIAVGSGVGESKGNPCEASYQAVATCFELDAILDVSGKKWVLLEYNKASKSINKLVEEPADSGENYFKWIHSKLNYDGVIIDSEGDYLLVLLPPGRKGSDFQALTLQDSAGKIVLPKSRVKGTSLLQVIQRSGRFAVFMPVITAADSAKAFAKGSKLIIEKGQ